MTQTKNQHVDVIISGGGLSGSLMALSLSKLTKPNGNRLSIAIIESQAVTQSLTQDKPDTESLFDARVLALSHGSANYLNSIGAWQYIKPYACAITDIDISDRKHFGKTRLNAAEYGVNALGYVVDMAVIGKAQLTALSESINSNINSNISQNNVQSTFQSNIEWVSPDSIADIEWQSETNLSLTKVTLASGKTLQTSLLLGCDGMQSKVRTLANISIDLAEYQQVALITNVSTEKDHLNKAFERFTEFGPIAILPLKPVNGSESRCSLVWTMTPEQAETIIKLSDDEFKVELEQAFGSFLGEITQVGKRDIFPLSLVKAQQQTFHRMALIGNASHTIHPIAGQGFNLGLRDVEVMAKLIFEALLTEQDIGSSKLLHEYQLNRAQDQKQIIELTDSLVTLFSNDLPPLVVGRNVSLQLLNLIKPLKKRLVKKTMGY